MTINEAPMASGARYPAPGLITVHPTVNTRKNVPISSTRYLFIWARKDRSLSSFVASVKAFSAAPKESPCSSPVAPGLVHRDKLPHKYPRQRKDIDSPENDSTGVSREMSQTRYCAVRSPYRSLRSHR